MAKPTVQSVAAQLGWTYVKDVPDGFREAWADLPGIRASASVQHVMRGMLDRWTVTAFVSTFTVYTGHVNIPVSRTVYAVDTPLWPMLDIAPRNWLDRLLLPLRRRSAGIRLEDPRFNATFRIRTEDEDFAVTLLSPQMQAFILTKPGVRWYLGMGRLCLIYSGAMNPQKIAMSAERLRGLLGSVPEEMLEWG